MPKKCEKLVKKIRKSEIKRYGYEKYNPYAVAHSIENKEHEKLDKHDISIGRHLHEHQHKIKKLDKHINIFKD